MKKWLFLIVILALGILQVCILHYFAVFNVTPDLLLLSVVIGTLILPHRLAFISCILAGVLKDLFATTVFPLNTILFIGWYFLILKLTKEISIENYFIRIGLVFIITVPHHLITGLTRIYLGDFIPLGIFLRILIIESIYTVAISLLVFKFLKPLARIFS